MKVGKLVLYMDSWGYLYGFAKRGLGIAFVARDLDKYLMQLGKCLAENMLPEE